MPEDDPIEFMKNIEKALGQDLSTLKTAEEKAAEEQAIADAAAEPIIYKTPTRMNIRSQPTDPQILGEAFFQPFVIEMYDQDDILMENVGVVTNPWRVLTFQSDCVETGPVSASVDGTTSVEFRPAVGTATFDNLIVHGDVTSCKFTFTISDPSDTVVANVQSAEITFLPPREEGGECTIEEGLPFDRQESWSPTCDYVCLSPCANIAGAGSGISCNNVATCIGDDSNPTYGVCTESGCDCNMEAVPNPKDVNPEDYIYSTCDGSGLEVRLNKCIANRFGFKLADLYIHGPNEVDDFSALAVSSDNNCRGTLEYGNGPEYTFRIDRAFSDCNTKIVNNGTHATYENAIQGDTGRGSHDTAVTRQRDFFASFGCTFKIDLKMSMNLGVMNTQSMTIDLETSYGEFNLAFAVYEDDSYTTVADSDFAVTVPDHIFLGMAILDSDQFLIQAKRCWATPDSNPENAIQYDVIQDGCANTEVFLTKDFALTPQLSGCEILNVAIL